MYKKALVLQSADSHCMDKTKPQSIVSFPPSADLENKPLLVNFTRMCFAESPKELEIIGNPL